MKTRVVIKSWNDEPIPEKYSRETYEKWVKVGWECLLSSLLSVNNPNGDRFEIESVELEE